MTEYGSHQITVDTPDGVLFARVCLSCGSLVVDIGTHDLWHTEHDQEGDDD